ncbi:MAG: DUF1566 domain-containing protein [Deltaproteobacteria bacterium]|nr:DUF1566 domain-containing protein [Deltaproteobacteria bacterium]
MRLALFVIGIGLFVLFSHACGGDDNDNDNDVESDDDDDGQDPDDDADLCSDQEFIGGTWEDVSTGLLWQTGRSCDRRRYGAAEEYCDVLTLGNFSDWRLPTISELRSLVRGCAATMAGGDCAATDECYDSESCENDSCVGCSYGKGPNEWCYGAEELDAPCGWFWSSTPRSNTTENRWCLRYESGGVGSCETGDDSEGGDLGHLVRCVRSSVE